MKKYLTSLLCLLSLQACLIGSGKNSEIEVKSAELFPTITGIDLLGKQRELPKTFEGKLNIVAVAFKREQQADIDGWIPDFEKITSKNSAVNFYEVPLIYELSSFSRAWVNNGMRFGIPNEAARKRTITVYTNRDKFFEIMKMKEDSIYVLLLDSAGKILWQTEGLATADKLAELQKVILRETNK